MEEYNLLNQLLQVGQPVAPGYGVLAPQPMPQIEVQKKTKQPIQPQLAEPIVAAFTSRPKFPTSLDEFNSLIKRQTEGLSSQREGLKDIESQIAELQKPQETNAIAPILMAASDLMAGTQFMKGYQTPEQKEQTRKSQVLGLQMQMQKAKGDLTDKEIDLFKAQYQDALGRERLAQEENLLKLKLGAEAGNKPKTLTASETEQLADLKDQMGSLDNVYTDWKTRVGPTTGPVDYVGNKASGFFPNTDVSNYKTNLKQKAQLIGKALEGGKLTDVDFEKYIDFLPQPGDTDKRARSRVQNLKDALEKKYSQRVQTFGEAGYDVKGFTAIKNKPLPGSDDTKKVMTKEEWIKAGRPKQ
jgi:hypothetical protein